MARFPVPRVRHDNVVSGFVSRVLSNRDQELVDEFVRVVAESGRAPEEAVADVKGLSGRNARRYVEEGYRPTRMTQTTREAMRAVIAKFGQEVDTNIVTDPEAPDTLQRVVLDPDNARRLVGQVRPQDVKSRLAIVRVYEDAFLEAKQPVPSWVEQLRQAVLDEREL